jgi:hypothetical protein
VCIFVREDRSFYRIDTSLPCAKQTLEVCAIKIGTKSSNLRILVFYATPSATFNQFTERLDATLKYLYNTKSEFLSCSDMNVDYLSGN